MTPLVNNSTQFFLLCSPHTYLGGYNLYYLFLYLFYFYCGFLSLSQCMFLLFRLKKIECQCIQQESDIGDTIMGLPFYVVMRVCGSSCFQGKGRPEYCSGPWKSNPQHNQTAMKCPQGGEGDGGTPYDGLYGEALSERGTFFRLQVYERVQSSLVTVDVYKGQGNLSFGSVKGPKRANR